MVDNIIVRIHQHLMLIYWGSEWCNIPLFWIIFSSIINSESHYSVHMGLSPFFSIFRWWFLDCLRSILDLQKWLSWTLAIAANWKRLFYPWTIDTWYNDCFDSWSTKKEKRKKTVKMIAPRLQVTRYSRSEVGCSLWINLSQPLLILCPKGLAFQQTTLNSPWLFREYSTNLSLQQVRGVIEFWTCPGKSTGKIDVTILARLRRKIHLYFKSQCHSANNVLLGTI